MIEVRPGEATPGGAIEVAFINTYKNQDRPLHAWLSVTDYRSGRQLPTTELQVLHERGGAHRRARARSRRSRAGPSCASATTRKSAASPTSCASSAISYRKLFREVIGGLALLFFGLRVMARGGRQYTGDRGKGVFAQIGRRTPAALGLGVAVGGITQFTTTAAGLVVGLVESHLHGGGAGGGGAAGRPAGRGGHPLGAGARLDARGAAGGQHRRAVAGPRLGPAQRGVRQDHPRLRAAVLRAAPAAPGLRAAGVQPGAAALHRSLPRRHLVGAAVVRAGGGAC